MCYQCLNVFIKNLFFEVCKSFEFFKNMVQINVLDSKVVERLIGAQTLVKHRDDRELLRAIQEKGIESVTSRKSQNW